jgi:hypothetical protein
MNNGVDGIDAVGTNIGNERNDVIFINDNPMYDISDVTAGPEVQARREL